MSSTVTREDPRFDLAWRTRNARFADADQIVRQVEYCQDAEDVAKTLQKVLDAGLRPTVRSSGHCYEDFIVNNPQGAILDVSQLNHVTTQADGAGAYAVGPGTMLGNAYLQLYRLANKTIPGGNCYTVTAGGHISGGGYGYLARRYGLTADYVTAVDIVTVDRRGKAVALRADKRSHPELLRALRGGQGSSFGVITAFYFDDLPECPRESLQTGLTWDWKELTQEKFTELLVTFGNYWQENEAKRETWGLFGMLDIVANPGRIHLGVQFTNLDGTVKDLSVVTDFLDRFQRCKPLSAAPPGYTPAPDRPRVGFGPGGRPIEDRVCYGEHQLYKQPWIAANVGMQAGSGLILADGGARAKYKSCYMKKPFTEQEAAVLYDVLSSDKAPGLVMAIDSYGGAVNNPDRVHDTAIPQRSSIMKIQYQCYWRDAADDHEKLSRMRDAYTAVYSTALADQQHLGVPYPNAHYDGCYINYPDVDMLQHDFWPQLYFGTGDLYPKLQAVKREYDPHNIFHHSMSVRP